MPRVRSRQWPKLKELLLYVAQKSFDDPDFGATKLNKILYYSDFLAFGQLGHPITEATYQRLDHGPVPLPLLTVKQELEREQAAEVIAVPRFNRTQKRLIPKRRARLDAFSADEIALVDEVIDALRGYNAVAVSELSHLEKSWQLVDDREEIPYEFVFLSSEPLTPDDVRRGQEVAALIDGGPAT